MIGTQIKINPCLSLSLSIYIYIYIYILPIKDDKSKPKSTRDPENRYLGVIISSCFLDSHHGGPNRYPANVGSSTSGTPTTKITSQLMDNNWVLLWVIHRWVWGGHTEFFRPIGLSLIFFLFQYFLQNYFLCTRLFICPRTQTATLCEDYFTVQLFKPKPFWGVL